MEMISFGGIFGMTVKNIAWFVVLCTVRTMEFVSIAVSSIFSLRE